MGSVKDLKIMEQPAGARSGSGVYRSVANEMTGRRWFPVEPLPSIMRDIQSELYRQMEKSHAS